MNKSIYCVLVLSALCTGCASVPAVERANPYIGRWALTMPGDDAGWLGVRQEAGYLDARIMWGWGSVRPLASVYMDGDALTFTSIGKVERKDAKGEVVRTHVFTQTVVAKVSGDKLNLTKIKPKRNGEGVDIQKFTGRRIAALPPRPDLSKVKYSKEIVLFNGTNLDGWKLTKPDRVNGWSVEDGVLINRLIQQKGEPHVSYGDLRTVSEFEDFNLKLEVNVPKKGNSGVYLRGVYEVQVSDSYGKELGSLNMGAIYSRITPGVNAEKPAGQWQVMNITLVERHVTVELNGRVIIDNQPLLGCTGGALWSDEFRPGPVYLQGDHTAMKYRNIVLTPIVK